MRVSVAAACSVAMMLAERAATTYEVFACDQVDCVSSSLVSSRCFLDP